MNIIEVLSGPIYKHDYAEINELPDDSPEREVWKRWIKRKAWKTDRGSIIVQADGTLRDAGYSRTATLTEQDLLATDWVEI